jgi:VWFA-related protein
VDIVRVDALVTRGGQLIRGLGASDFEVKDNGVVQDVTVVSFDEMPLNVVLAVDLSPSVARAKLDHLRSAGRAVLGELKNGDRAGMVTFGSVVAPSAGLTGDFSAVGAVLDMSEGEGDTSLVDGVFAGLMLGVSDRGRSLLLVFSDGMDTASWLPPDAVIDAAKRGDVVVYGVVSGAMPRASFLRDLTAATGGDLVEVKSTTDLKSVFLRLLNEYRQRYLVGYVPKGVARGGWHQVEVRVKGQRANVKARPGYLAGAKESPIGSHAFCPQGD